MTDNMGLYVNTDTSKHNLEGEKAMTSVHSRPTMTRIGTTQHSKAVHLLQFPAICSRFWRSVQSKRGMLRDGAYNTLTCAVTKVALPRRNVYDSKDPGVLTMVASRISSVSPICGLFAVATASLALWLGAAN